MSDFIDTLQISQTDKAKLKQLGTDTPFALLALIEAAPDKFSSFMGGSADLIREQVGTLVPPAQRRSVLPRDAFSLGAQLSSAPRLVEPTYDVALRDRLFQEWQTLQQNPSTRDSGRAKELEQRLSDLLER